MKIIVSIIGAGNMGGAVARGLAALIQKNGSHPEQEVDKVTTPGGLTIRGLNAMEEAGFTGAVVKGLRACIPV